MKIPVSRFKTSNNRLIFKAGTFSKFGLSKADFFPACLQSKRDCIHVAIVMVEHIAIALDLRKR